MTVEDNGFAAICELDWKVSFCYVIMVMDGNGICMGNKKDKKQKRKTLHKLVKNRKANGSRWGRVEEIIFDFIFCITCCPTGLYIFSHLSFHRWDTISLHASSGKMEANVCT